MDDIQKWYYDKGKYFGYPECCIRWFIEVRLENPFASLTPEQDNVHGFRGFLPCPTCAKTVTRDTLHTLIRNRACLIPFGKDA